MELKKMTVQGREVEFVNAFRDKRYGFAHDTTLFIDGRRVAEDTAHYVNRTWERYTYQTVMRSAVYRLIGDREVVLKHKFMQDNGYKKLTPQRKIAFAEVVDADADIKFYREIRDMLA